MSKTAPITAQAIGFGQLRDWLELLAAIRNFNQPIDSPEGLRQAIAIVVQLGEALNLDPAWLAKFRAALENPAVFDIVLAVERYVLRLIAATSQTAPQFGGESIIDIRAQALGLHEWLTLLVEVLQLLGRLRGSQTA
jgi:hypothetical protein